MKSKRNILIAFILNFAFSVFEFFGGFFTGSVAIISDAVHDMGDAASIGVSFFLENKSQKQPDSKYTYGYARFSVLGSVITLLILSLGSVTVIYNAILRIITPSQINYDGMIIFAIIGVCINFAAAYFTREGHSLNQKAVNLHMLEDVLGWIVILAGAIIMSFTGISIIDPIMSIGVAVFILVNTIIGLKQALDLFLEKAPCGIDTQDIKKHLLSIDGIIDVHHLHIWSLDGQRNCATLHIVTESNPAIIKKAVRAELQEHGIGHVTVEHETNHEECSETLCCINSRNTPLHLHHHHSH